MVALLFMALAFVLMRVTGRDDSHITYWAARALRETGEIQNISGDRFEQSSSLLMTLWLALLSALTNMPIPLLGVITSAAAGVASFYLSGSIAERLRPGTRLLGVLLSGVLVPIAYWSLSGMETTATAALLAASMVLAQREPPTGRPGSTRFGATVLAASVGLALVRPDAPLYWLAAWLVLLLVSHMLPRLPRLGRVLGGDAEAWAALRGRAAVFVVAIAVSLLAVGAWREFYFGDYVPAPVRAKVGGVQLVPGFHYLFATTTEVPAVAVITLTALGSPYLLRRSLGARWMAPWTVVAAYGAGVVAAGGGWMALGRMFVPVLPVVAALVAVLLRSVHLRGSGQVALITLVGLLGVLNLSRFSTGTPIWAQPVADYPPVVQHVTAYPYVDLVNRIHFRDAHFAPVLRQVAEEIAQSRGSVSVASGQAGEIAYYGLHDIDGLRFIDVRGLTSNDLLGCSESIERTRIGFGISYPTLFKVGWRSCGVDPPDVIFDLGLFSWRLAPYTDDYCLVLQFTGQVESDAKGTGLLAAASRLLPTRVITNEEFLAVRADLLPLVSNQPCRSS